jgi:hypothetical protein
MCRNMEKIIFFPNQISRVVNSLKRDSISVKTLGIVSLGIASYISAHYLSGELDT